jgi:hypothetical protein
MKSLIMKAVVFAIASFALFISSTSQAHVSFSINLGTPPVMYPSVQPVYVAPPPPPPQPVVAVPYYYPPHYYYHHHFHSHYYSYNDSSYWNRHAYEHFHEGW